MLNSTVQTYAGLLTGPIWIYCIVLMHRDTADVSMCMLWGTVSEGTILWFPLLYHSMAATPTYFQANWRTWPQVISKRLTCPYHISIPVVPISPLCSSAVAFCLWLILVIQRRLISNRPDHLLHLIPLLSFTNFQISLPSYTVSSGHISTFDWLRADMTRQDVYIQPKKGGRRDQKHAGGQSTLISNIIHYPERSRKRL